MRKFILLLVTLVMVSTVIEAQEEFVKLIPISSSEPNISIYSFVNKSFDGSFFLEERNDSMNATAMTYIEADHENLQIGNLVLVGDYKFVNFSIHYFNPDIADSSIVDHNYSIIDSGIPVSLRFNVLNEEVSVTNLDQLIRVCLADELENVTDEKLEAKIIRRNKDDIITGLEKGIVFFAKRHIQSYGMTVPIDKEIDLTEYMTEAAKTELEKSDDKFVRTVQLNEKKKSYTLIKNTNREVQVPDSDVVKNLNISEVSEFIKKKMILISNKYTFKNKVTTDVGEGMQEELTIITKIQGIE